MHVGDQEQRPPLLSREGWISDGRQVLHFQPLRYDRWSQALEVTLGEVIPGQPVPLLKRRKELTQEQAIKLWRQKRGLWSDISIGKLLQKDFHALLLPGAFEPSVVFLKLVQPLIFLGLQGEQLAQAVVRGLRNLQGSKDIGDGHVLGSDLLIGF